MLGVDEGGHAAGLLGLRDDVQGQRGLARGLGTVDLDDAAARHAADAQGQVQGKRSGRNGLDAHLARAVAQFHDGLFSVGLLDLRQRQRQRLLLVFLVVLRHSESSSGIRPEPVIYFSKTVRLGLVYICTLTLSRLIFGAIGSAARSNPSPSARGWS